MRSVFVIAVAVLAALPAAFAQTTGDGTAPVAVEEPQSRLDRLFSELKRTRNEQAAERISARIQQEWAKSGSATVDLLMQWAQKAAAEEKTAAAMDFLDQVTMLAPGYAEGWNRRAILHVSMDEYGKAMSDIRRTLELEPRHFGALEGMAALLEEYGRKQAALHAYERLLDVYPMMRSAQTELGRLADEIAGQGI